MDLLDEAKKRMLVSLQERRDAGKSHLSDADLEQAATNIGYGAVKYFDPKTDYKFSYDSMLSVSGDTAVYLQFAHARLASIVRKGKDEHGVDVDAMVGAGDVSVGLEEPAELALAIELLQFPDVVDQVLTDFYPHRICEYLYNISGVFTQFVTKCFVLDAKNPAMMKSRLVLCEATGRVMRKCFEMLGITPLHRI